MKIKDLILKTEKVDWQELKDLQPVDLKNNYHSDKTKKSIIENGFARAIYVWQDQEDIYIVDGHLRSDVLRELKNDGYEIPEKLNCTFLDLPDKTTAIKYLLQVFNQKTNPINHFNMENWLGDLEINLATDLKIDIEELHVELPEVEEEAEEEQEEVKEDEVPEVKHNFVVKGDLFELIDEEQGLTHRVLCGDSTMIDDVEKVMNGEKADMVFTDPPYNINFKPQRGTHNIIKNDNMSNEDFESFLLNIFNNCKIILKNDTYLISFMGWSTIPSFKKVLEQNFLIKSMPIWVKNNFGIGYYTRPKYEPFFLCLNGNPEKPINPPADVFEFAKVHKTVHSCEKPINLIVGVVDNFVKKGLFFEPFLGSGSTLIACQQTKRKCYGIELDEHYCGVVITRWKNYMEKEGKKYSIKRNKEEFNF